MRNGLKEMSRNQRNQAGDAADEAALALVALCADTEPQPPSAEEAAAAVAAVALKERGEEEVGLPQRPCCGRCTAFVVTKENEATNKSQKLKIGECHANPPSVVNENRKVSSGHYPVVYAHVLGCRDSYEQVNETKEK
jgi:hypothetical protein